MFSCEKGKTKRDRGNFECIVLCKEKDVCDLPLICLRETKHLCFECDIYEECKKPSSCIGFENSRNKDCKICTDYDLCTKTISKKRQGERINQRKIARSECLKTIAQNFPRYESANCYSFSRKLMVGVITKMKGNDNIYCFGKAGTGKTHLAVAVFRHMRWIGIKKYEIVFVKSNDLLLDIKQSFNSDSSENEDDVILRYCTPKMLVIDDIGAEKISEWVQSIWYQIIDKRYTQQKPILFTSNLRPENLSDAYGERIASRILSGISFEIKGEDRRLTK